MTTIVPFNISARKMPPLKFHERKALEQVKAIFRPSPDPRDIVTRMADALAHWAAMPGCRRTRAVVFRDCGFGEETIRRHDAEAYRLFCSRTAALEGQAQ